MSVLQTHRFLFIFIFLTTIQIIEIYCKRSFILIAPKEFDGGKKESLRITLLDIDTPGTVSISLVNHTGTVLSETIEYFNKEGSKRTELQVPTGLTSNYNQPIRLKVNGTFGDYTFEKKEVITLRNRKELLFLDTDKPIYKAGQTIKFRVLIVNSDLKPLKKPPVGSIWITDKNRVRVAQWMNITFENGFVHEELKLPEEPVLGSWMLHVQVNTFYRNKYFTVKEYVLPTFEVNIIPPSNYYSNDQNLTWKICANYTYGKPVEGKLLTELKMTRSYYGKQGPTLRKEEEFVGCTEITHHINDLIIPGEYYTHRGLEMFAEVTEYGTDTKVNASSTAYVKSNTISMIREDNLQYFRAGLPFHTKLVVRRSDSTPVVDATVAVCAEMKRLNWRKGREIVDKSSFCRDYKTNQQGKFIITVPPQTSNTIKIGISAKLTLNNATESEARHTFTLFPWYSFTGHFLQIQPLNSVVECGNPVEFEILYTTKLSETGKVYYQVMSKGDIVHDGLVNYAFDSQEDLANYHDETYLTVEKEADCHETENWNNSFPNLNHIGKFILKFDVDFKMSPKARLILYSVNKEGNILADSTSFEVKPCFENPVEMKFSEERQLPGEKTTVHLSAAPKSVCSVGIIDKSVHLMEKSDVISKSKVYDELRFLDTSEYALPYQVTSDYEYCSRKAQFDSKGRKPAMEGLGFVDSILAFKKAGVMILSDLELETRPCKESSLSDVGYCPPPIASRPYNYPQPEYLSGERNTLELDSARGGVGISGMPAPSSVSDISRVKPTSPETSAITVRSYFPETWLWGIYFVGKDGELFLKEKMPDSITEWQGTSVCLHPDAGLGISESVSIVGFQPFFTSLTLPYSVIRGETVPIIVTVFNYLKECLPIKIHLDQTDDFQLHNGTLIFNDCICGSKSVTRRFFINPKTLGKVNITVTASTTKDGQECNNVEVAEIIRSDTLIKPLIVEAEGIPKEETLNIFVCMEDVKDSTTIYKNYYAILLTDDIIEGSARAFFSVTGDVMGPTLEGLENLVRVPTGCGEQNMVTLVPNIVVLDYLKSTNRLTDEIRQKAINHIKQGYIRQQNYRHNDGSYSAFGKHDQTGSMWLTAFVLRSFASAARYIDVDKNELTKSRNWIISHQQDNGCFPIIGMVHNTQMKGGVGKEDKTPAILTAYVLTSLLLSGDVDKAVIEKAMKCIEAKSNPSDYALSIFAYATSFIDEAATLRYLGELNKNAVTEGLSRYWENKDKSIAIETASYAIISSLNIKDNEREFQNIGLISRWLSLQRNAYGGFMSTQDTIIALEALAKYAALIKRQKLNMRLTVKSNDLDEAFELDEGNELLTQRIRIPIVPASINLEARGTGCALVQTVNRYNVPSLEPSEYFILTAESKRKQNDFKKAIINICVSLSKEEDESNMIVMEVKMISGFVIDKSSVEYLLTEPQLEIKRFEIKENQFNLYFAQLTSQNKCFHFDVIQELIVEDTKPANIKVYDYYDQDKTTTISYSIGDEYQSI